MCEHEADAGHRFLEATLNLANQGWEYLLAEGTHHPKGVREGRFWIYTGTGASKLTCGDQMLGVAGNAESPPQAWGKLRMTDT